MRSRIKLISLCLALMLCLLFSGLSNPRIAQTHSWFSDAFGLSASITAIEEPPPLEIEIYEAYQNGGIDVDIFDSVSPSGGWSNLTITFGTVNNQTQSNLIVQVSLLNDSGIPYGQGSVSNPYPLLNIIQPANQQFSIELESLGTGFLSSTFRIHHNNNQTPKGYYRGLVELIVFEANGDGTPGSILLELNLSIVIRVT